MNINIDLEYFSSKSFNNLYILHFYYGLWCNLSMSFIRIIYNTAFFLTIMMLITSISFKSVYALDNKTESITVIDNNSSKLDNNSSKLDDDEMDAVLDDEYLEEIEDFFDMGDVNVIENLNKLENTGKTTIPRDFIENLPTGNGNITDVLKIVPGVQFSNDVRSSSSAGEIAPDEISISGGRTYENLFMVDGVSNSSSLDPAADNPYQADDVSGGSYKFFIDSSIIKDIIVYDSNIPASYGGFTGGVVDIVTKTPGDKFELDYSYKFTGSEFTHFFITEDERYLNDSTNDTSNQLNFSKSFHSLSSSIPITDDLGLLLSYKLNRSTIPLNYFNGYKDQSRMAQTVFLKGVYNIDGSSFADLTTSYSPNSGDYFIKNTLNSDFEIKGGGVFSSVNYHNEIGDNKIKVHVDYNYSENSREAPQYFKSWIASDNKPWGETINNGDDPTKTAISTEGGWGSIYKTEQSSNVSFDHTIKDLKLAGTHEFSYGLSYKYIQGRHNRKEDAILYNEVAESVDINCGGDSGTCVDGEQYFSGRTVTPSSNVFALVNEYALYAQDSWKFYRFNLRVGLRVTYDDFMDNVNFAPRTELKYDIFNDNSTVLTAGYNRYFSATLLANKLKEGVSPSYQEQRWTYRNQLQDFQPVSDGTKTSYNFSELRTPYVDEFVGAVDQSVLGGYLSLKYIARLSDDGFARESGETEADGIAYYRLNNNGSGTYQSVQMSYDRKWTNHRITFNVAWQHSITSNDSYEDIFNLEDLDNKVVYNGNTIPLSELPKDNYNKPVIVNLAYVGKFFKYFKFSTFVTFQSPYKELELVDSEYFIGEGAIDPSTGKPTKLSTAAYETKSRGATFIVDCAITFEKLVTELAKVSVSLEINNLFNIKNDTGSGYGSTTTSSTYEMGRQFWLKVGYVY